jgi:DNA (cytosine-5)-methyltransferase 1
MNELALFAGAGGGILGGHLLGWRTVCAVEWEAYPASVLVARQNDKILPPFPIWDDVQTFDGKPWRGIVDVVSGGFPCQDISLAGRGDGLDGERSGMWKEMARIISEVRPKFVFVENSPMLTHRGLERVLADLSSLGFDTEWGVLGADFVQAPHRRERIWILGKYSIRKVSDSDLCRRLHRQSKVKSAEGGIDALSQSCSSCKNVSENFSHSNGTRLEGSCQSWEASEQVRKNSKLWRESAECGWWKAEPNVGRVANGVAARVDRLKAIGNGQVPLCAATAWNILKGRIDDKS